MSENKIYWFRSDPDQEIRNIDPEARLAESGHEEGLFRFDVTGSGKMVFLEIEDIEEESLLDVLVRNCVETVVDIRADTVFSRPKFRHKEIVEYLYQRGIGYVEYNIVVRDSDDDAQICEMEQRISAALDQGLMLCLLDAGAKERKRDNKVRRMLEDMPNFVAEVNTRSLLGLANPRGK